MRKRERLINDGMGLLFMTEGIYLSPFLLVFLFSASHLLTPFHRWWFEAMDLVRQNDAPPLCICRVISWTSLPPCREETDARVCLSLRVECGIVCLCVCVCPHVSVCA